MSSSTASATRPATAAAETCGIACAECRRPLPIRDKEPREIAAHWECAACHTPIRGVLVKEAAAKSADAICLSQVHFDTKGVPRLSESLRQLVREFFACRQEFAEDEERRALPRAPMLLDFVVVPVDENWSPCGKPIMGVMINVSASGFGMVSGKPVEAEHVAVQFQHSEGVVQLLGRIIWSKDFGPGFHHTGVQFLLRFGRGAKRTRT